MAFPSSPYDGQQYTSGGYVYQYVAATRLWKKISAVSTTTANATITTANITSSTTNTAVINNATVTTSNTNTATINNATVTTSNTNTATINNASVTTANVANLSVTGSAEFDSVVLTGGISANGTYGTPGYVLKTNGSNIYWASVTSGGGVDAGAQYTWTNTQTFSNTITFSTTINGTANNALYLNGKSQSDLNVNSAVSSNTANNSSYLNGKTESNLNVNSAVSSNTANNSSYLNTKTESNLNVNSALTANASSYLNGKTESNLNVNNSLTSNNSTYLGGKIQGQLNVNNAVTANSAVYLNGKLEADLNVNSSLTANASTYLNGKTEINLNVNNSLTANSSTYVNGKAESALNVNSALTANSSTYVNGKAESALNVNSSLTSTSSLTSNNSAYLGGAAASDYQTTAGLSANVSKLDANNSSYLGGVAAAQYLYANVATFSNTITFSNSIVASNVTSPSGAYLELKSPSGQDVFIEAGGQLTKFHSSGTIEPSGRMYGSAYGSTYVDVTDYTLKLGGELYGVQIRSSPDRMQMYDWTFGTEGKLSLPGGLSANGSNGVAGQVLTTSNTGNVYWSDVLSANNSAYLGGTAASGYQTISGLSANVVKLTANAAGYLNGKLEADLNVNSALSTNNAAYLGGIVSSSWALQTYVDNKAGNAYSNAVAAISTSTANDSVYLGGVAASGYQTTAGLSANVSKLTANAAGYLNSKTESNLNVNSALTSNASTYLNGKTESNLNVNSSVSSNTANNSSYLNAKTESNLNVNSSLTANAATYLNGKTESNLNVNSALVSNNSAYLGGTAAASYALQTYVDNKAGNAYSNAISYSGNAEAAYANAVSYANTNFAKLSGATFTGNIVLSTSAGLVANGSVGTSNQVLISNGSTAYWAALAPVRQNYSSNGSQTTFTISGGYTPYNLDVYINGVKLLNGADVDVSNGSTFTLTSSYPTGTIIEAVGMVPYSGSPGSYVSKTGDTMSGTLTVGTTVVGTNYISVDNVTGNLIPSSNLTYSLGNTSNRWKDLWIGSNSITFSDTLSGPDQTLRVANQVFYIAQASSPNTYSANAGFNAGGVILQNFSITLANTSQNLTVGKVGDTGNTIINRATQIGNGSVFSTVNATSVTTNTVYTNYISANGTTGISGQILVSGDNTSDAYWGYNQPNTRIVTATTYTATANDSWIGFTANSSTLTLPNTAIQGKQYTVACFGGDNKSQVAISVQSGVTLYANGISTVDNSIVSPTSSMTGKFVFVGSIWYGSY